MVEIRDKEHFRSALAMAKKLGGKSKQSFRRSLTSINRIKRNYARGKESKLIMTPDFVKHSFAWGVLNDDGRCVYNGGMILHGFEQTFAVQIDPQNFPNWSIHT